MEDMQSGINAILNNPDMMQKIMSMAQSMGAPEQAQPTTPSADNFPEIDMSMLKKLSGIAGSSRIDKHQKNLLSALSPYLSDRRIQKLEKAMRAAKLANLATTFLGSGYFDLGR